MSKYEASQELKPVGPFFIIMSFVFDQCHIKILTGIIYTFADRYSTVYQGKNFY
jgi:hypothetical protein